jgi:hypothetical protein
VPTMSRYAGRETMEAQAAGKMARYKFTREETGKPTSAVICALAMSTAASRAPLASLRAAPCIAGDGIAGSFASEGPCTTIGGWRAKAKMSSGCTSLMAGRDFGCAELPGGIAARASSASES